ncbi:hypothetical protein BJ944DRAFT_271010 [Cunninghamella echinulata]|nr:hypothetical protein BJ944DRAFT_271010 [Cunninghamella echinulata]
MEAIQDFNGGFVFVSYIISVIGSMTTLELLSRRTHIRGRNNWYLLLSAALSMGSVGIWSMHFIGNNSLTIRFEDQQYIYQLAYSAGYTFASLVVAIACMFISFLFIGVTEHVQVYRIVISGVLAGIGIATMHYLGQFAIQYFKVVYKPAYVVAAVIIACTAVTVALFIFFKLRERWANQWYKRLACACIMGVAVCGMHYTAMAGTRYYDNGNGAPPPVPALSTPVLIGLICAVVVIACLLLFYVGVKCSMERIADLSEKRKKRLVVDLVLFDQNGRIMVNVDGILPSKVVLSEISFKSKYEFNASHPLFVRLFCLVSQWSIKPTLEQYERASHSDEFNIAERRFHEATSDLMESLRMENPSELGVLYESVIKTHTVDIPSLFPQKKFMANPLKKISQHHKRKKQLDEEGIVLEDDIDKFSIPSTPTTQSWSYDTKKSTSLQSLDLMSSNNNNNNNKNNKNNNNNSAPKFCKILKKSSSSATLYSNYNNNTSTTNNNNNSCSVKQQKQYNSSTRSSQYEKEEEDFYEGDEERHVVLVRQLDNDKHIHKYMTQGYRFADTCFIAKTMGAKLFISTDRMLQYFNDMRLLAQSHAQFNYRLTTPRVMVGVLGLVNEHQAYDQLHMIVDKQSRYGFPMVELTCPDTSDVIQELSVDEKHFLSHVFHNQPLAHIANMQKYFELAPRPSFATTTTTSTSTIPPGRTSTNTLKTPESNCSSPFSGGSIGLTVDPLHQQQQQQLHHKYSQSNSTVSPISLNSGTSTLINSVNSIPSTATATLNQSNTLAALSSSPALYKFASALELAAQKLLKKVGSNGLHLGLSRATLQADIIDAPAFSVTSGPCSLILFRIFLQTQGTIAAIQLHTNSEPIRCLPYSLDPSLAHAITQQVVETYEKSIYNSSWGNELQQQILYGNLANYSNKGYKQLNHDHHHHHQQQHHHQQHQQSMHEIKYSHSHSHSNPTNNPNMSTISSSKSSPLMSTSANNNNNVSSSTSSPTSSSSTPRTSHELTIMTSLPPPPRAKRNRHSSAIEMKPTFTSTLATSHTMEVESSLVILPPKERFLWLDQAVVECLHSSSG